VGVIAISAAAVDDVVAWILLSLVVTMARAANGLEAVATFVVLSLFFVFMITFVKRTLHALAIPAEKDESKSFLFVVFVLVSVFVCSWFTEAIGVHAIFGGFVLGVVTPRSFALRLTERIEDLVVIVFLPAFFAYSGLQTDLSLLSSRETWGLSVLIILTACAGKFGGSFCVTKALGNTWRESLTVGVLMNTKGLVELIVLNIGLQIGVLTQQVFSMFVLMALVTTFMTTPLVHWIYIKWLEANVGQPVEVATPSILICPENPESGRRLIAMARLFQRSEGAAVTTEDNNHADGKKSKPEIEALYISPVSDRPSTYAITSKRYSKERKAL